MDGIVLHHGRPWTDGRHCVAVLPILALHAAAAFHTHTHSHTLTHSDTLTHSHTHCFTERETEREFLEWVRVNESSALRTFLAMTPRGCP